MGSRLVCWLTFHDAAETGASSSPISPYRCQPTAASQVRGATTGDRVGSTGIRLPQPLNQAATNTDQRRRCRACVSASSATRRPERS